MDTPDSLTLLRRFAQDRRSGRVEDGKIIVGEWMIDAKAHTNYKTRKGAFLSNEAVFFFIQHMDEKHGEYMKQALQASVPAVSRVDRVNLQQYLLGEIKESDAVDPTAPTHLAMPAELRQQRADASSAAAHEAAADEEEGMSAKRAAPHEEGALAAKRARQEGESAMADKEATSADGSAAAKGQAAEAAAAPSATDRQREQQPKKHEQRVSKAGLAPLKASQATRNIMKNELVFQTRTTVLKAKGKSFVNVLKTTRNMLNGKGKKGKGDKGDQQDKGSKESQQASAPTYERYNQPAPQQDSYGNVDIMGTNYQPGTIYNEDKPKEPKKQAEAAPKPKPKPKKRTSKTPIIIVPGGATAKITLANVKAFLEEGKYLSIDEALRNQKSRPQSVYVYRKRPEGTVPYHVIDNVAKLSPEDWKRVVAVVVAGPKWQFKDFPEMKNGKQPVDIFCKYRAFYINFKDERVHPNAKEWDCSILQLSRSQRHLDQTASRRFWETLDQWTAGRYPLLRL
ncbi:hypothetical protein PTSG_06563 [Salpingoeca rosetta]|uniref:Cell division control protein 73 C-terminal domain-containing protein n=1 Tax=Salpingoeca rosetta (strain ATCC 50818 / BSB-021) TaxID=946362 RepID=F2UG61_SALR5|nr:uncharacterized protein PTSG_06563 [Salpingoeca rosetta]EGD75489.1 hypothetical protein PTSG_06563 [Salpingoeca rosetta]|eukprot:XP_004991946.1 hypothetical protein PTSG_06563 [Salpingoeca rosetta]